MESGRYSGEWWLPENPDFKIRGNLVISTSELVLEIEGVFSDIDDVFPLNFPSHEFIHGNLDDGKIVTLHLSLMTSFESKDIVQRSNYRISHVFAGAFFANHNQLKFKTISIEIDHLDDWIGNSSIRMQSDKNKKILTLENEKIQRYKINGRFRLKIDTTAELKGIKFPVKELVIRQRSYLTLFLSENLFLDELLDTVRHLQNFFSFALCSAVRIISVGGYTACTLTPKDNAIVPYVDISHLTITSGLSERRVDISQTHFRFGDVKEKFSKLLQNWFEKKD